jgi:hypothetical protein
MVIAVKLAPEKLGERGCGRSSGNAITIARLVVECTKERP